jgi:hypothetical protein
MAESTKPVARTIAVLKLPEYEVSRLITQARAIVRAMTDNPLFAAPRPPLGTVCAAIDALDAAQTATLTRAVGTVAIRDEKRLALVQLLQCLRQCVQVAADAHLDMAAAIIEGAGMAVKKTRALKPRVFAVRPGRVSGSVQVIAPKAGHRAGYEWGYTTDGGTTWQSTPITVQASTTVSGLRSGSRAAFRYRAATKNGLGNWSHPVSILVV